ncbi:hypothetical protein MKW94_006549 [Papaver nudicaule]|uniref:Uncharacterized protein n=1 Tax=Papaver nudicaule TaxID=74823 RepID=A0AA41W231_PAPNU|nr:hypothetical protein [Papaver nudicaule]
MQYLLQQEEAAAAHKKYAALRDDIALKPNSISLFSDGFYLKIRLKSERFRTTIPDFEKTRFSVGLAKSVTRTCEKVKREGIEELAAEILAFFIQPEEGCIEKERCSVEHVEYLLHELVGISFTYTVEKNQSKPAETDIFINFHHEFLQGKDWVVRELRRTLRWIGKDHMDRLRKDEELELIRAHRANRERKISRRQRLRFQNYFV